MAEVKSVAPVAMPGGGRSVNYPGITLELAVKQIKKHWTSIGKYWVPIPTAGKVWGYGEKSSGLRTTVSAMKQYGLIQDMGDGEKRQVKLTDRAIDIAIEPEGSPKWREAIRAAAMAPKIYADLMSKFPDGLPAVDHAISSYLLREKNFNRKTVDSFISDLRANFQFANLDGSAIIPSFEDAKDQRNPPKKPNVGDLVQWEADGVLRLEKPLIVTAIQDEWVFVEGSDTGIPMSEVIIERTAQELSASGNKPNVAPPRMPLVAQMGASEREWLRGPLGKEVSYRIIVTGEVGAKEIGKLIKVLTAQQAVLSDDDEDEDE